MFFDFLGVMVHLSLVAVLLFFVLGGNTGVGSNSLLDDLSRCRTHETCFDCGLDDLYLSLSHLSLHSVSSSVPRLSAAFFLSSFQIGKGRTTSPRVLFHLQGGK